MLVPLSRMIVAGGDQPGRGYSAGSSVCQLVHLWTGGCDRRVSRTAGRAARPDNDVPCIITAAPYRAPSVPQWSHHCMTSAPPPSPPAGGQSGHKTPLEMVQCNERIHHRTTRRYPGADPGGGRWGARPPLGQSFTIQNALFNSIQALVYHWAPTPGRNPVSAPDTRAACRSLRLITPRRRPVPAEQWGRTAAVGELASPG